MKKKKWLIPVCILLALALLAVGAIAYMNASSLGFSAGRYLSANGSHMVLLDASPVVMSNRTGNEQLFSRLSDGDRLLVLHDGIAESYPAKTGAYAVFKLSDGSIEDISAEILTQLDELGWQPGIKSFSFRLTWGCYGVSSYDSKTGELIKTTDATHPEDYVAEAYLTDEQLTDIYDLISEMDVNAYPDEYNPHDSLETSPPMTLILSVNIGGTEKTIRAENIALSYETYNKKGRTFLSVCKTMIDMLTATEEWKALPEYEFLYY